MTKVPLRIYNREIESLIEQEHINEAIAHCQHILRVFPKHLETYRLLGKAYLEGHRHNEATDIFKRVLMVSPDDFISHVGMSIIRDDEGKLDETIWHMERAFEAQPSNAAVQGELKRLYGRRDGIEPPKIRMTRGALAHMYVQGELFPQAIAEIKSVLAEDPQRADMQVLLAQAYFRCGQKVEASEICSTLLNKYPYNLEANRILAEVLPGTNRAEDVQVYRQRLIELDPYMEYVTGSVFKSEDVPDTAVSMERMEGGEDIGIEQQVSWTDKIGIEPEKEAKPEIDWLKPAEKEPDTGSILEKTPSGEEVTPDVIPSAGLVESDGVKRDEQPEPSTEPEESGPELAQAEIPEWIKAMAPAEAAQSPEPVLDLPKGREPMNDQIPPSDEIPDWLKDLSTPGEEPPEPVPSETVPKTTSYESLSAPGMDVEDQDAALAWLEDLAAKHGAKPEELTTKPEDRPDKPPDWILQAMEKEEKEKDEKQVPPKEEPQAPTFLGDWLSEKEVESGKLEPTPEEEQAISAEKEPEALLRDLATEQNLETSVAAEEEAKPIDELDRVPTPEPVGPVSEGSDIPVWLEEQGDTTIESQPVKESEPSPGETTLPEWISELRTSSEEVEPAPLEEELPTWLREEEGPKPPPQGGQSSEWQPVEMIGEPEKPGGESQMGVKVEPEKPEHEQPPVVQEPKQIQATMLRETLLTKAQAELSAGNIQSAINEYGGLIKRGRLLDEVIHDLREALYRFPVDVSIWQALGDAYMRANRLQDALDAYTKAEELLR